MKFVIAVVLGFLYVVGAYAQPATNGAGVSITPPPGIPASGGMGGVTTALLTCDGATDNQPLLAALMTSAAAGNGTIYIPPAKNPCMMGSSVTVPDGVDIIAWPNSVILKAKTGNTSSPLLLNFSGNATGNNVYGVTLDGGGTAFGSANNVNVVFNSTNVVFDHVTVQNTRGIGIQFSTNVINSGVRDSSFISVGAIGVSQGVAFCCGSPNIGTSSISGTTLTTGNSVTGLIGAHIYGLGVRPDTVVLSGSGTSWTVSQSQTVSAAALVAATSQGNFVKNSYFLATGLDSISYTQQHDFAALGNNIVSPGTAGAGIYDHSNDTTTIVGNTVFGNATSGNCIDLASTWNATVTGNSAKNCGGSGIAYAYASHATITGNVANNNGQNGLSGEGTSVAGIFLTGTSYPVTDVVISGNEASDLQSTPTQKYGIEMQTGSTFSNINIDPSNSMTGNVTARLSSLITNQLINGTTVPDNVTVTMTIAAPGVITWTAHGLSCLQPVYFSTSGALPTGINAFTTYYITCGVGLVTANTFQISTTEANALAGTSITTSGTQSGTQTGHTNPIQSSGSAADVMGLQLSQGDYDCQAIETPSYGGATSVTAAALWLGTTGGAAMPATPATILNSGMAQFSTAAIVQPTDNLVTGTVRFTIPAAGGMVLASFQSTYTVQSTRIAAMVRCWRAP